MKLTNVNVEITLKPATSYPILIGENLLENAGSYIKKHTKANKLAIVTNTKVFELYGKKLEESLLNEDFKIDFIILEDGEKYKNIETLTKIWDKTLEFKLERKDALVALGGGVVGDITGFAASTYLRGIDFVQIPTTLLAQVDSSVGGKVAINHPLGKNMIGAFYQPKLVIADIDVLKTLPERELKTGLAEVLKYGFIENTCGINTQGFIDYLKSNKDPICNLEKTSISYVIEHSCKLKAGVVNQDEKEKGLRAILNLGHTIGHAIERCTNYNAFTHGEAVAMGLKGALILSKKLNLIDQNYLKSSLDLINTYDLEYRIPQNTSPQDIFDAMMHDKKVDSGKKRLILPTEEANVKIFDDIEDSLILSVIEELY